MTHKARTEVERPDTETGTPRVRKYGRPWYRLSKDERRRIKWQEALEMHSRQERFYDHHLVYFIQEPTTKAIKIGVARDPHKRLRYLQTAHPCDLVLLGTCRGGLAMEKLLHLEFAADQLRREWFRATDDLLKRVAQLCAP